MGKALLSIVLTLTPLLFSCNSETAPDCLKSKGKNTLSRIDFNEPIKTLFIQDDFEVILKKDSTNFLELEAGENLLPKLEVRLEENLLSLKNKNRCNWVRTHKRSPVLSIHYTQTPETILHHGIGKLQTLDTLKAESFKLEIRAVNETHLLMNVTNLTVDAELSGSIKLRGKAHHVNIITKNLVSCDALELSSNIALLENQSERSSSITCTDTLNVAILSTGNVYFVGKPLVRLSRKGKGELVAKQ